MALRVDESWIQDVETKYPGFREQLADAESSDIPLCPVCGSANTARVAGGLIGRTIRLAAATTKFKLVPNDRPADFYCNACDQFFDVPKRKKRDARR
jgi:hypothetical protein